MIEDVMNYILTHGGQRTLLYIPNLTPGQCISNASITTYNNDLVINFRTLRYLLYIPGIMNTGTRTIVHPANNFDEESSNWIGVYHPEDQGLINAKQLPRSINTSYVRGREDIRLITWNEQLYGICARPDIIKDRVIQEVIHFDNNLNPSRVSIITDNVEQWEKNWAPVEGHPFTSVYSFTTGDVVKIDSSSNRTQLVYRSTTPYSEVLSGSSQVIRYKDYYITIVHNHYDYPRYQHKFLCYDSQGTLVSESQWFNLNPHNGIEFVGGMCIRDNVVYITYTCFDTAPTLLTFSTEVLDNILGDNLDIPESINEPIDRSSSENVYDYSSIIFKMCDPLKPYIDYPFLESLYNKTFKI